MSEVTVFNNIFNDLAYKGQFVKPRGLIVIEIENYNYELGPYQRFCNFKSRKLNLDYIKQEFLWYLKGDPKDLSILQHAKIWSNLVNEDGTINSNYGQYIFGEDNQFDLVIKTLKEDKDSRRAMMVILNSKHLHSKTKDVPCTISIGFRIRNNKLNMTVRMRSQDAIFGMGNDAPTFSFIHEMVYISLKEFYPDLKLGNYYHSADSFHVYDRHFEMLNNIVRGDEFIQIDCPKISGPDEVRFMRKYRLDISSDVPKEFKFVRWLLTKETKDEVQLSGNSD